MRCTKLAFALPALLGLFTSPAHANLVITPTFDSTITSDPNAATIEATLNSAIQVYETDFINPINVKIDFQEMSSGLGESTTYYGTVSYTTYRNALIATKALGTDSTAFEGFIPAGANNPVNGNTSVNVKTANLRAIGLSGTVAFDSTIGLNTSTTNISRSGTQDPSKYDLFSVASHEIDEALGLGSSLDNSANTPVAIPTGPIEPEDLYRFSAPGVRSLTNDINANSYLSVNDGATNLVYFNQTAGGDFGDYKSQAGSPKVQDAFGTPGSHPNLGTPELTALQDIGYNRSIVAAPEPSQLAALGFAAFGALGLILRVRKRRAQS